VGFDGAGGVAAVELDLGTGFDSRALLGSTSGASPIDPYSPAAVDPLNEA
jgi:hypothetical protein